MQVQRRLQYADMGFHTHQDGLFSLGSGQVPGEVLRSQAGKRGLFIEICCLRQQFPDFRLHDAQVLGRPFRCEYRERQPGGGIDQQPRIALQPGQDLDGHHCSQFRLDVDNHQY